ncbi:MAG TPA: hypothetical protein VGK67_07605 [Myxococcales bacterium]|jgi:hypothetical protein
MSTRPHSSPRLLVLSLAAALLAGCATAKPPPSAAPEAGAAPVTVVDAAKLGPDREAACARLAEREVKDVEVALKASGMLPADFEAIRRTVAERGQAIAFRDSNPACLPHLAAGVQSKPHDILEKTWDASNLKPEDQDKAGLVSTLFKKPPKGEKVDGPQLKLKNGEPVTCDYDLMEMLDAQGKRIRGETALDLETRAALNGAIPATPRGHRDRVMHGAQAAYGDYLKLHPEEKTLWFLYKPEAPLTAFGKDGKVYRFEKVEDSLNLYTCAEADRPQEWRIEVEASPAAPPAAPPAAEPTPMP